MPCKRKQLHPGVKEPDLDCSLIVDHVRAPFTPSASTGSKGQALSLKNAHTQGTQWSVLEHFGEQSVLGYSRWVWQAGSENLLAVGIADQQASS